MQVILAAVLVAGKSWRTFPAFVRYSLTNLLVNGILFIIYRAHWEHHTNLYYYYSYWVGQGLCLILGLGVIFEVFSHLFAPYPTLKKLAKLVSRWTVVVLLMFGMAIMWAQPASNGNPFMPALLKSAEILRIVEVGMVTMLFLFAGFFGLHWRQPVFGIALGSGVYWVGEVVTIIVRSFGGPKFSSHIAVAGVLSFDVSLLIWIGYLSRLVAAGNESPEPGSLGIASARGENQLEQWNKALTELIYQ